ncbi:uncharacterized protein [Onthophagus taurus]|uniref:uncharacterized protein n=1 Tax=Onthophagus taurus TaxID=166361 RepID=UPI000C20018E|nr:uncharacterized protein LOC111428263 [Onthophagus taurus]XP_022919481.1 uncharacterized protein LOC111428263 [Onthophagus taurus]
MLLLPIISLYCQILLQLIGGALTLKDVTVTIPQAANIGDTITLQCHYDLEEEPLYTVKWYKGDREFFRYIPKELPSTQVFPYLGMDIDIGKSTPNSVVLRNVQQNMTGRYGCEVSTDAPNFYTIQDKAYMFIVQTPMGEPEVFIEKELYEINYVLRGNCSSPISYPAMNLTWYLNGKKEPESFKTTVPTTDSVGEKRRPASTIIGLETEVDSSTFKSGKMVLRCRAEFFNLYQSYAEVSLEEEKPRPRPSSVLGTRDASSGSRLPRALFMISYVILVAIVMR